MCGNNKALFNNKQCKSPFHGWLVKVYPIQEVDGVVVSNSHSSSSHMLISE